MELQNLEKAIQELNAPKEYEGEQFDSLYDFTYEVCENFIRIYDRNERFSVDMDAEIRCEVYAASKEFGFEYQMPESETERIMAIFKEVLELDLEREVVIEWDDYVCLSVYIGGK